MKYAQLKILIDAFSEPYRGTIYHYTSAEGISGIINKHEIWMSNSAFMNDTTELKMLQSVQTILKGTDFKNNYVKNEWIEKQERQPLITDRYMNYYIASFSRKKDMLEQWRAYGNFCIGFDAKKLDIKRKVSLYSCLYTKNDIRKWLLNKEKIDQWKLVTEAQEKKAAAYNLLHVASMKYKNEHFKSEKEIRLVTTSNHNWTYKNSPDMYANDFPIHFRNHPIYGFPVPYVKFFIEQDKMTLKNGITLREAKRKLKVIDQEMNVIKVKEKEMEMKVRKLKEEGSQGRKLLPISEVIIGPMANQKEAKTACEILLAERGYKTVKVSVSNIPYRGI
jgi:hypothetical protein